MITALKMLAEIMNLGVAVVARCDAIRGAGRHDLIELDLAEGAPLLGQSILQKAAAPAAAIIVGAVGGHIDKIFLTYHGLDHKSHVFGHRIAKGLATQLAGILAGKFDLTVLVPFGADLQLAFPDPLGV